MGFTLVDIVMCLTASDTVQCPLVPMDTPILLTTPIHECYPHPLLIRWTRPYSSPTLLRGYHLKLAPYVLECVMPP